MLQRLRWIVWIVTGRCNLVCKHCYASRFAGQRELDHRRVSKLLEEAAELGIEYINFTGGEPLLYPRFDEVLKTAADHGIEVGVFTNLTLLSRDWAKLFSKLGVYVLSSLDGASRQTHEANRGLGTWDKTMEALKLLRGEGVEFGLTMAISKHNCEEAGDFVELSSSLGASSAAIIPVLPSGRALKNKLYADSKTFLEALKRADEASSSIGYPLSIWCASFAGLVAESPWVRWWSCRLSPSMDVDPTGRSLLCDVLDVAISSVEKGLKEAWRESCTHPLVLKIARPRLREPCASCRFSEACLGGCFARAYVLRGDLDEPDPLCPVVSGLLSE